MVSQMLDCRYKLAYYAHRGRLDDDGLVAEACWPLGKCKCNVRWLSLPGEQEKLCLHKTKRWKMMTNCREVSVVIDIVLPDIHTYWHLEARKSTFGTYTGTREVLRSTWVKYDCLGLSSYLLALPGGREVTTTWKPYELKGIVGTICANAELHLKAVSMTENPDTV